MNRWLPLVIVFSVCLVVFLLPTLGVIGVGLGLGCGLNYFVPAIGLGHAAIIGVLGALGGVYTLVRVVEMLSDSPQAGVDNDFDDEDSPAVVVSNQVAMLIKKSAARQLAKPKTHPHTSRRRRTTVSEPEN